MLATPILVAPVDRSRPGACRGTAGAEQSLWAAPWPYPSEGAEQSFWELLMWPAEGVDQSSAPA